MFFIRVPSVTQGIYSLTNPKPYKPWRTEAQWLMERTSAQIICGSQAAHDCGFRAGIPGFRVEGFRD